MNDSGSGTRKVNNPSVPVNNSVRNNRTAKKANAEKCLRIKIADLQEGIKTIVGTVINRPITKNKGEVGVLLEKLTGIPQSSACLDCEDGELKVFPVKRNKAGKLIPKETIAVTMINKELLKSETFENSRVFKKLSNTLYVPYERTGDNVTYLEPTLVNLTADKYKPLYEKLKTDYDYIRNKFIESDVMSSEDGVILQNRTKGAGHGSTSRAFYLKKEFSTEFISF
jgi:DNA mismatch repair protein MutH